VIRRDIKRENGTISSLSVSLVNDKRNNRMETTGGHYLSLNEEYAGLGGNRTFTRTTLDTRFYRKIWGDLTFRSKFEAGTIWDYKGDGVQRNERFLLGGSNNLRGYGFADVGPRNSVFDPRDGLTKSFNTGGLHELIFMSELEYPLVKDVGLKLVLFYDAGDAFGGTLQNRTKGRFYGLNVKHNYGWGFRWFSPLGPLRFEWGYPLKPDAQGRKESQFNFMIGPPF